MKPAKLPLLGCALLLLSGCISVDPSSKLTPTAGARAGAEFRAPVAVTLVLKNDDEDLRKDLTAAIADALDKANVPHATRSEHIVTVTVAELRRVSRASRVWNGQLAGRVKYRVTIQFSDGTELNEEGDLGARYGYHQATGATTADGIRKLAEIVAAQTAKRLKEVST